MVYSTRRFVLCLTLCYFVLVIFNPFSIAMTSLWEERSNLSTFRTFIRCALFWFCLFPHPLCVWKGLRFVIVAHPGLFSYLFLKIYIQLSLVTELPTFWERFSTFACHQFIVLICLSLWSWGLDVDLIVSVSELSY